MRPNLPSQIAHRAVLPVPRLSEQLGIVVSSRYHSSLFVDYPFTATLHEPVCSSNACSLRRSLSAPQLNLGPRRLIQRDGRLYQGMEPPPEAKRVHDQFDEEVDCASSSPLPSRFFEARAQD